MQTRNRFLTALLLAGFAVACGMGIKSWHSRDRRLNVILITLDTTLAEALAERGYATGAFIAAFVLNRLFGLDRGFDTYDDDVDVPPTVEPPGDRKLSADQVVDRALAWLT